MPNFTENRLRDSHDVPWSQMGGQIFSYAIHGDANSLRRDTGVSKEEVRFVSEPEELFLSPFRVAAFTGTYFILKAEL